MDGDKGIMNEKRDREKKPKRRFVLPIVSLVIAIVCIVGFAALVFEGGSTEQAAGDLVEYLNDEGFTLYYSTNCPACIKQVEAFGEDFDKLNAVNCETDEGRIICYELMIFAVPTWVHEGGGRHEGYLDLTELSAWSGYSG